MEPAPPPPPSLEHLQDWENLDIELYSKPWEHYEPFLASRGYVLFGSSAYDDPERVHRIPRKPARRPFFPAGDEDFIHRVRTEIEYARQRSYVQLAPIINIGLDTLGRQVFLRALATDSMEHCIMKILTSPTLRLNPRNRTIPVLEYIPADKFVFVVQPFWGAAWDWPPFNTAIFRLEMAKQLLEGLSFMHENNIAHGDIHNGNLVWNYADTRSPDFNGFFHSQVDLQMAFIDFGAAKLFQPGESHLIMPYSIPPSLFAAPEQSKEGELYDIFASDVYNLGKVLQKELDTGRKKNNREALDMPILAPGYVEILDTMVRTEPAERPTSGQALETLLCIIQNIPVPSGN